MESLTVSVEELGKFKRKLQITVPMEAIQSTYNKAYNSLKHKVNIPGFRKGHYPQSLLEKRFKKQMSQEALKTLVPKYFEKALKQENMELVGKPQFTDLEVDKKKPLVFSAVFELKPDFELPGYKSFQLEKRAIEITPQDISVCRKFHLDWAATYQTADEPVAEEDQVVLDYVADPENEHVPPRRNFHYTLGSEGLDPEVDEALIGMKTGEEKTIVIQFTEDHAVKELQGTSGTMKLKIIEVKKKIMPELNEAFFSRFNDVETEEDFENFIRNGITEVKALQNRQEYRKSVKHQLAEKLDFELPEQILKEKINYWMEQATESDTDELKTDAERRSDVEKKAKEELRLSFYLQKILQQEKIEVDNAKVRKRFWKYCRLLDLDPVDLARQELGRQIYRRTYDVIAEEAALDFVTNKVLEQ